MSKHKIIGLVLCGLMLTSCGSGGENTAAETELPEASAASESVSKTTVSETETEAETELPEVSETVTEETESTENFDKVKDRIVYDDGVKKMTAGEYLKAIEAYGFEKTAMGNCGLQFADLDGDGMPEAVFYEFASDRAEIFSISPDGEVRPIPSKNEELCWWEDEQLKGGTVSAYEKDGETIWIMGFSSKGAGAGSSGRYILRYDGNSIDGEIICEETYDRNVWNDDTGWDYTKNWYLWGEEVTEEEYESRKDEFLDSLRPSDAAEAHGFIPSSDRSLYDEFSKGYMEAFSGILLEYCDMLESQNARIYNEIAENIIYSDGENTLTAGQYIEALLECEEFTRRFDFFCDFQIMDMDENGIPEIMIYYSNFMSYTGSRLYTVTKEGKAEAVPILNHDICDSSDHSECYNMIGENPVPYEKDGKTVWISRFSGSGTGGGGSGNYILKYDGSGIDGEIICESRHYRWNGNNENGELEWYRSDHYYIFGEDVTEEEYDKRRDEYMNSLKPSDELYVIASYDEDDFRETFSYALNNYLDMRDDT